MPGTSTTDPTAILSELRTTESQEALDPILLRCKALAKKLVTEVMCPNQSFEVTRTELCDLYGLLRQHWDTMQARGYTPERREQFREAIVALLTVQDLFTRKLRFGEYRERTVEEVVSDSRPWRGKLRAKANHRFFFEPARLAPYQDHNESGTLDEEVSDIDHLLVAAREDIEDLKTVGFDETDLAEGQRLLAQAHGRNLRAVAGIRSQAELKHTRDTLLSLAILLARHARAAGISAFWDSPEVSRSFERVSFRKAMRRLRRSHSTAETEPEA